MRFSLDVSLVKKITYLAVPAILGMLTQTAVNLLDTAMVGRLPGSVGINGVAAIGLSLPVFWALGGFLSAIAIGTQAITARRVGEGELKLAGRVLSNALIVAGTSGLVVSIIGYFLSPWLFTLLSPNPDVAYLAGEYCRIRMLGIFSMVTTIAYKGFFDGIGKTYVHLLASVVMNLLNAFLNFVLIFGSLGFPRLEVRGAALASLISTYVGLTFMIVWSLLPSISNDYHIYSLRNLKSRIMGEIVRLSLPSGLATVFVMSGFEFFFWVIAHLPSEPVLFSPLAFVPVYGSHIVAHELTRPDIASSASWVIISCLMLVFMTSIAMGTATATLVSQSLGAKNPSLAERYGWESVKLGMYTMGTLGLLVILAPSILLGIFTDKEVVLVTAQSPMRLMGAVFALMSAGLILVQALFGAGATTFVMVAELLMHGLCLVPLSYLLSITAGLGLIGAWMAAAIYVVLLSSIMAWKFYGGSWKKIHI